MNDNKIVGNFYKSEEAEKAPAECPNCLYQFKDAEKEVEECPNCYYIPNKTQEKKE